MAAILLNNPYDPGIICPIILEDIYITSAFTTPLLKTEPDQTQNSSQPHG